MPRITEFTVIFDEDILSWIAERFQRKYPLENGVFLFGEYWPSRFNIPYITQAHEPSGTENTADEWKFDHSEVVRRTRLAASDGYILLGFSHSHPWRGPFIGINHQSITDARTQITYRFTISLIVGVWKTGWWCHAWREGFAAPLSIIVKTNKGKLLTLKQWYYRKYSKRPWHYLKNAS